MGRDRADDDVGLAPLSDDELVAWGEELRRATADGPRHLAPRPLRAQGAAVPVRARRTEPLRATPPPVTPPPVAPPTTWSVRPRGRPLVAEPGISTRPA
jgi:hypothetical protein